MTAWYHNFGSGFAVQRRRHSPFAGDQMDPTAQRGVLIGLGSIIAVCGAVLLLGTSAAALRLWTLSNDMLGFSPDDGDGSMEVMLVTVLCHDHRRGGRSAWRLSNRSLSVPNFHANVRAQSGHTDLHCTCPLSGVKRT